MPKSFLFTIRGYRDGKYRGCAADCQNVMTTRSGLIIDTRRVLPLFHSRNDSQHVCILQEKIKPKSCRRAPDANNLSIVTRYSLFLSAQSTDEDDFAEETSQTEYFQLMSVSSSPAVSAMDGSLTNTILVPLLRGNHQVKVNVVQSRTNGLQNNTLPCPPGSGSRRSLMLQPPATIRQPGDYFKKSLATKNVTVHTPVQPNINTVSVSSSWKKSGTYLDGLHGYCRDTVAEEVRRRQTLQTASSHVHESYSHSCAACGRIFTVLSAYYAHLATHSKQNSRCSVCHKEFKRSWLLKGHMRTHTGERPYKCVFPGCERAFADKSNLRSHTLIHQSTTKTFVCERCGRAFAQKRYLHKHRLEVCKL